MTAQVSIALGTFNGARFIGEQLASLDAQTAAPLEIVVGDDGSSDDTCGIIERFAAQSAIGVALTRNPQNLGFGRNFAQIALRCRGSYVFFCDQDDRWAPEKLAVCLPVLQAAPAPSIVTHDAWLADERMERSGLTLQQQQEAAGQLDADKVTYGCCIGFDAFFLRFFTPRHRHSHDTWLFEIATLLGARIHLSQPLIDYRRHGGNATASHATSLARSSRWRRRLARLRAVADGDIRAEVANQVELVSDMLAAFERNRDATISAFGEEPYESAVAVLKRRLGLLEERTRLLAMPRMRRMIAAPRFRQVGGYAQNGLGGMLRDILA